MKEVYAMSPKFMILFDRTAFPGRALGAAWLSSQSWFLMPFMMLSFALCVPAAVSAEMPVTQQDQTFRDCSECPDMIVVPSGNFAMGASDADVSREISEAPWYARWLVRFFFVAHQQPQHQVAISRSFALGKYPVTRNQFEAFLRETSYSPMTGCITGGQKKAMEPSARWDNPGFPQTQSDPVVCVSWQDAQAYAAWLNNKLNAASPQNPNGPYRLPTEAEWEYAARAGTHAARWWGDQIGVNNANCRGCSNPWNRGTAPVDVFLPNPFGLYDILGNIFELTEDCWHKNFTGAPTDGSAWLAGDCQNRSARGAAWDTDPAAHTSSERTAFNVNEPNAAFGFRIAKDIAQ